MLNGLFQLQCAARQLEWLQWFVANRCFNNKELELDISKEQQKFIIIDSVNEPLPPEAENVEYMPSDIGGPQVIPNAKLVTQL